MMKKYYIKYIFTLILFLIIVIPTKVSAITSDGDYTIESYDVDMVVNEDNTFDITEKIIVNFDKSKHRNI